MKKILSIMLSVLLVFSVVAITANAEESEYPIDAYYSATGSSDVKTVSYNCDDSSISMFNISYPAEAETADKAYPIVIFCNGTGMKSKDYSSFINHLASWGYIVAGNDSGSTGTGKTTLKTLDFVLELNSNAESIFYEKIDTDKIALVGHSQGGSSTINSASIGKFEKSPMFKTIVSINGPHSELAASPFQKSPYDASLVQVPAFLIGADDDIDAGTSPGDGICPLDLGLTANMNAINNDNIVIGQVVNSDHNTALDLGKGYIVAWLQYILFGDSFAAGAFEGLDGEIYQNSKWQNTRHKTSGAMGNQVEQNVKPPKKTFFDKIADFFRNIILKIKNFFDRISSK